MYFHLDGREAASRDALHALLARGLHLPAHYGKNLDALCDLLSEGGEPVTIEIVHAGAMRAALGGYAQAFMQALEDMAAQQATLRVIFRDE